MFGVQVIYFLWIQINVKLFPILVLKILIIVSINWIISPEVEFNSGPWYLLEFWAFYFKINHEIILSKSYKILGFINRNTRKFKNLITYYKNTLLFSRSIRSWVWLSNLIWIVIHLYKRSWWYSVYVFKNNCSYD